MKEKILLAYGIDTSASLKPFGHGLINSTWKVEDKEKSFILQKVNTKIFLKPEFISKNTRMIADHFFNYYPGYFFLTPCKTIDGQDLFVEGEGCYRMFPFINNSHAANVAENVKQTFEAARMFGQFTKNLSTFPVQTLKITLTDFHNISLRYHDFLAAVNNGLKERVEQSTSLITFLNSHKSIVDEFEKIKSSNSFKIRVTHHDTKINNVLFDDHEKGICVIDLDTLMPGYFISDVGDMIRTYTSPVDENEKDLSKIEVREDYYVAIAEGYISEMQDELSEEEIHHFVYAGKFMIYMQALRFLTDYLNNDVYYGSAYEGHNFYRAANQAQLLKLLIEQEERLSLLVLSVVNKLHS